MKGWKMFIETLFVNQCYYARSVRQICTSLGSAHTERLRQWQRRHCIAIHCDAWKSTPSISKHHNVLQYKWQRQRQLTLTLGVSILLDRKITITVLLDLLSLLSHLYNPWPSLIILNSDSFLPLTHLIP